MTYILAFFGVAVDVVVATRLSLRAYLVFIGITIYLYYIYKQKQDRLDHLFLANTLLLVAILDCAGNALDLYSFKLLGVNYDKYLHFFSPMLLMIGFGAYLSEKRESLGGTLHVLFIGVLILCIGASMFELYESYSDLIIGTDMVHGYTDTLYDVILDYLGILLGATIVFITVSISNQFKHTEFVENQDKLETRQ